MSSPAIAGSLLQEAHYQSWILDDLSAVMAICKDYEYDYEELCIWVSYTGHMLIGELRDKYNNVGMRSVLCFNI